jgi:hypothetical protein
MRPEAIGRELKSVLTVPGVEHLQIDEASENVERMKKEFGSRLEVLFDNVAAISENPDYANLDSPYEVSVDSAQEITNYYVSSDGRKINQGESLSGAVRRHREIIRLARFYLPVDEELLNQAAGRNIYDQTGPVSEMVAIGLMRREVYEVKGSGDEKPLEGQTAYHAEAITFLQADNLVDGVSYGDELYDLAKDFENFIVVEETGEDLGIISKYMNKTGSGVEWLIDLGYRVDDSDDTVAHAREESSRRRRRLAAADLLDAFGIDRFEAVVAAIQEDLEACKDTKLS